MLAVRAGFHPELLGILGRAGKLQHTAICRGQPHSLRDDSWRTISSGSSTSKISEDSWPNISRHAELEQLGQFGLSKDLEKRRQDILWSEIEDAISTKQTSRIVDSKSTYTSNMSSRSMVSAGKDRNNQQTENNRDLWSSFNIFDEIKGQGRYLDDLEDFAIDIQRASYGSNVAVRGTGVAAAFGKLNDVLNQSKVRYTFRNQRFYEKPSDKKNRLRSQRHRRRFQEGIQRLVSIVKDMKAKGL